MSTDIIGPELGIHIMKAFVLWGVYEGRINCNILQN